MNPKCRTVVMIGGNGSNLQAIIDSSALSSLIDIVGVISHRPKAYGLIRAINAKIPTSVVDHTQYTEDAFNHALADVVQKYQPQLILLAGFMRILTPAFIDRFAGIILNIHPALLPKYKGLHTHQRVIEAGDSEHGATVHFVTSELDSGPIVAQIKIPVYPKETAEELAKRVLVVEHWLYPQVIQWFAQNRLKFEQKIVTLDGKRLTSQDYLLSLPATQGIVS
ncbi:MAG: phosphoribosylglycinamide formyltransferase [Proteobacteria bacterium]|nr:phosphoribosylglycinamide formyltransferase [Pseudomonadota bacterium]